MDIRKTGSQVFIVSALLLVVGMGIGLLNRPAAPVVEAGPSTSHTYYLPLIQHTFPGIYGTVYNNGTVAAGVPITLEYYDGATTTSVMTTTTSSAGTYQFANVPSLASHQRYYAQYTAPSAITGTLKSWNTASLTTYQTGASVSAGNFDIADVTLVSPSPSASVSLPYTFTWNVRPASTTDNYHFELHGAGLTTFDSGGLNYVGSYTLNSLPAGYTPGGTYSWSIKVVAPDGANGYSSETRKVTIQ